MLRVDSGSKCTWYKFIEVGRGGGGGGGAETVTDEKKRRFTARVIKLLEKHAGFSIVFNPLPGVLEWRSGEKTH